MQAILSDYAVSVTELKRNYAAIVSEADGAVAVLNHNKPESYLIPAHRYEELMAYLEDLEDMKIMAERAGEVPVAVDIDDL